MTTTSVKRKLVKARMTLNHTVQKILDINHNRKRLSFLDNSRQQYLALNEELKVLNKIAAQQARLVRYYEDNLGTQSY